MLIYVLVGLSKHSIKEKVSNHNLKLVSSTKYSGHPSNNQFLSHKQEKENTVSFVFVRNVCIMYVLLGFKIGLISFYVVFLECKTIHLNSLTLFRFIPSPI